MIAKPALIGIVIAAIIAVAAVVVAIVLIVRRNNKTAAAKTASNGRHGKKGSSKNQTYGCVAGTCTSGSGTQSHSECANAGCTQASGMFACGGNGTCVPGSQSEPGDYTSAQCQTTPGPCEFYSCNGTACVTDSTSAQTLDVCQASGGTGGGPCPPAVDANTWGCVGTSCLANSGSLPAGCNDSCDSSGGGGGGGGTNPNPLGLTSLGVTSSGAIVVYASSTVNDISNAIAGPPGASDHDWVPTSLQSGSSSQYFSPNSALMIYSGYTSPVYIGGYTQSGGLVVAAPMLQNITLGGTATAPVLTL